MARITSFIFCVACLVFIFIENSQAKPHGFKGSRKGRNGVQQMRIPFDDSRASLVRTRFTTTPCSTGQTATPTSPPGECKRTKVAILGGGVAGITAAVGVHLISPTFY
jgi:hypothetical protein